MTTFVLATANPHKAEEMSAVLTDLGFVVRPRPGDVGEVDETENTLEGNALVKARALCGATGEASIADDTGLFVDALGGRPGVFSARFAGAGASDADNVAKLLAALADTPEPWRARFVTAIAVAYPDGGEVVVDGTLEGEIVRHPRGAGGFGYDPVFEAVDTPGRTLAELASEEKNRLSHRARALAALAAVLVEE